MLPTIFVPNILCRKFPFCVSAAVKIADTKRVDLKGARHDLPAHNDPRSSLFLASILCFFCALLSRYRAVGMRLNRVLTSPFEMQRATFSQERNAPPLFLPRAVWFQRPEDRSKKKSQPRSLPAGTRVPGLSARISTTRCSAGAGSCQETARQ